MNSLLFQSFTIKDVTFKNRIVMSSMHMYYCPKQDGKVTDWHLTHYTSRAVGQVGLIMTEGIAINLEGRYRLEDLGVWSDDHIDRLSKLTHSVHENGAKIGIQLSHAGRKSSVDQPIAAPSAIPFPGNNNIPKEMTIAEIDETIRDYQKAARRAKLAGFDVIEIHACHGALINQFLSPLANKRADEYGGTKEKRYRFLSEVIEAIKEEWSGPLFVRISANEYHDEGNKCNDYVDFAIWMKEQGIDLIVCSSGGVVVPVTIDIYPGYQVQYAEQIRRQAGIATGAVGLITEGVQAEEIIHNQRADLVYIGRELLRNPYWAYVAAKQLGVDIEGPKQYGRAWTSIQDTRKVSNIRGY